MNSLHLLLLGILLFPYHVLGQIKPHPPIKNAFYKIINPTDGTVLTVTEDRTGFGPKHVIMAPWTGAPTQIWKVKTMPDGLQIIRNEEIKNNEVSKERTDGSEKGKGFTPNHWNLVEHEFGMYEIYNGHCHLHSHGKNKRITFDEDCDVPQLWEFVFVKEI